MAEGAQESRTRGGRLLVEAMSVDPTLAMRIAEARRRLARLAASPSGGAWAADVLASLESAAISVHKYPRSARAAEGAWMAVHQARHGLCLRDDRAALIEIFHEVEADLSDHAVAVRGLEIDRHKLIVDLVHGAGEPGSLSRHQLYALSIMAARQREADWYKANHLVQRRFRAALAVIALLVILVVVLPVGLDHVAVGQGIGAAVVSWAREAGCIVAVMTCGALGGLLSVLLGREQLQITAIEHHLVVATSRLRPVVGAASAVVFFVLWESGLLRLADAGQRRAGAVSGTLLLLAVMAGFSERLLLGQIERLSEALQRTAGPPLDDLPSAEPPPPPPPREAVTAGGEAPADKAPAGQGAG